MNYFVLFAFDRVHVKIQLHPIADITGLVYCIEEYKVWPCAVQPSKPYYYYIIIIISSSSISSSITHG